MYLPLVPEAPPQVHIIPGDEAAYLLTATALPRPHDLISQCFLLQFVLSPFEL